MCLEVYCRLLVEKASGACPLLLMRPAGKHPTHQPTHVLVRFVMSQDTGCRGCS